MGRQTAGYTLILRLLGSGSDPAFTRGKRVSTALQVRKRLSNLADGEDRMQLHTVARASSLTVVEVEEANTSDAHEHAL